MFSLFICVYLRSVIFDVLFYLVLLLDGYFFNVRVACRKAYRRDTEDTEKNFQLSLCGKRVIFSFIQLFQMWGIFDYKIESCKSLNPGYPDMATPRYAIRQI